MRNQPGIYFGLVILLLFANKTISQNLNHTGLLFTAAPNHKEQRTSLDLTRDSPIAVRNKFSLEFDLAIWNREQFGYVFRIYDKHSHNIDLVYIPKSSTLAVLKLAVNGNPTQINIALEEKDLVRNNWLHLTLNFDLTLGKVVCKLDNREFSDENINLDGIRKLFFCFGINRSNYYPTADVPHMAIRNIRFADHNQKVRHHWLLNESEGNEATDLVGNLTAEVSNPTWVINNHFYWTKMDEFTMEASSGVTFDTLQNRLLFIGKQKLISYNIIDSEVKEQDINNIKPFGVKTESYYYSTLGQKLFSIGTIPNQVNVYDEVTNQWDDARGLSEPVQYINSTFFMHEQGGAAYSIGGYGNYKYYDVLLRYDLADKSWRQVLLQGDKLVPRYFSSVTETPVSGQYYVFGGYGHATGQQELGPQCLYDLYFLDLNKSVLTKKWTLGNVTENFVPMGSTRVNEQNDALYVLGFPPFLNDTYLKLYRISLDKSGYSVVSDTIHFYFDELQSKASLFYFHKTREFYAVVKTPAGPDSAAYKIYSLTYPPVNRSYMSFTFNTIFSKPESFPKVIFIAIGLLLIGSVFLLRFLLKRLHQAEEGLHDQDKINSLINNKSPSRNVQHRMQITLPQKNAIYLFGDFRIYDDKGRDLGPDFSSKLRQLFYSIFLLGADGDGIANEKLNAIHWTYHSPASAKNNRNVNIKKLRDLLCQVKGVQVVHAEGHWSIKFTPETFSDYHFLLNKIKGKFQPVTYEEFERINLILEQGGLIHDEKTLWLDSFKSQFLSYLLDYLFLLADSFEKEKNPEAILRIADLIMKSDPLNDEAFKLKISALIVQRNHSQAFAEYENFAGEYKRMYGIHYPVGFKALVTSVE